MFANVKDFFNGIAEVQWIDGIKPSEDEEKKFLQKPTAFWPLKTEY